MRLPKQAVLVLILFTGLGFISCRQTGGGDGPDPDSGEYQQAVADFYISLGASETDQARFAFNKMNEVAQLFPEEPAAWANLGVYALRQGNFELARERIGQALELAPENPDILFLAAIIESRGGNITESIEFVRRSAEADPSNLRALYFLALELEREDDAANAGEIRTLLEEILDSAPENQVILLERIRVAAKEENDEAARQYLERLGALSVGWGEDNRRQIGMIEDALGEQDYTGSLLELSFLRSGLEPRPAFQADLLEVQLPPTNIGYLIPGFLSLPQPEAEAAEPDSGIRFSPGEFAFEAEQAQWIRGVTLREDMPPLPVFASEGEVVIDEQTRLPFPGSAGRRLPVHAFAEIDYNYDFMNDIALAGENGFRLFRQNEDQTFTDVTDSLQLGGGITGQHYNAVWPVDVEMDGDLDLLLSPDGVSPVLLRNNGDGTFSEQGTFGNTGEVRDFLWADMDGDGAPEAVFLTGEGSLTAFKNERGGRFGDGTGIAQDIRAAAVADIDADSRFDILTVDGTGRLQRHYFDPEQGWQSETLSHTGTAPEAGDSVRLFAADFDNNGAVDLLISTPESSPLFLGDGAGAFIAADAGIPGGVTSVFDIDGDERLDLMGIDGEMRPFQVINSGTKDYFARSVRARASGTEGDQRINSFGIGGEMEIRSGLLYQKQLISSPIVHFGLGEHEEAEMLRIIWPNGSVQAEFAELGIGSTIFNEQILKGSCPWLFTHDGDEVRFITDILWRSPLGLRINALETAGVAQTLDRVKIPGDALRAADGVYDVRITAELWESHFFDYVSLVAVDHPEGTEIFVDERFVFPAPDLSTQLMRTPRPVAKVTDRNGADVTGTVSRNDEIYLQSFRKTAWQGLAEEHSIEIELAETGTEEPLWLVMSGWLRPTDSSINLALSQGTIEPPKGLHVEVPDGAGGWKTLHENFGIPAGKLKTVLLDLEGAFEDPSDRRVRLTTTSEIYWDSILQAEKPEDGEVIENSLEPEKTELRYRGFSEWGRADSVSPKLPDYSIISGTNQRWRDLEGFHTRFGDVRELLLDIDDRYVIMNAGDELLLTFREGPAPKEGYKRSFVFVSDGWEKDGDYNTEASATVLPLPYHGQDNYGAGSSRVLRDDPVYRRFSEDWIFYHTRYITPDNFRYALRYGDPGR